jgi:hypothetical protein
MKERTNEEIVQKLKELFKVDDEGYEIYHVEIDIQKNNGEEVYVKVHSMYRAPGLGFARLKAISEFFESDNIVDSGFGYGGCSTCDYGSKYGFYLTVKP